MMLLPLVGIVSSLAALVAGLNTGNPFLLIYALLVFGLSLGAVDFVSDRDYERNAESLNVAGQIRVGYEREDLA